MPRAVDKLDQYRRMIACGLPALRTEIFKLGATYDEAAWTPYLFVKSGVGQNSSNGEGKILRTATAHLLAAEDITGEAGKTLPLLLVQPFIDTGLHPVKYRVLVLAGSALYAQYTEVIAERPPLASLSDKELLELVLDTGGADRFYQHKDYPEVVALAEKTAKAFAKLPVLGIDIVQSAIDGRLYVLEINGGGNVWHFSSSHWQKARQKYPNVVEEMKNQLGAWPRAAAALAKLARDLAA